MFARKFVKGIKVKVGDSEFSLDMAAWHSANAFLIRSISSGRFSVVCLQSSNPISMILPT